MRHILTIRNAHSDNGPKQELTVEMMGGSPWYGYIWINDKIYTVTEGARTVQIKPTKYPKS